MIRKSPVKKLFVAATAIVGLAVAGAAPAAHAFSLNDASARLGSKIRAPNGDSQSLSAALLSENRLRDLGINIEGLNQQGDASTHAGLRMLSHNKFKDIVAIIGMQHDDGNGNIKTGQLSLVAQQHLRDILLQGGFLSQRADGSFVTAEGLIISKNYFNTVQGAGNFVSRAADGTIISGDLAFIFNK